jgi:hypothetical protein
MLTLSRGAGRCDLIPAIGGSIAAICFRAVKCEGFHGKL